MDLKPALVLFAIASCVVGCDAITALVGKSANLPCDVAPTTDDKSPYVIQWLRQKQEVPVFMKIGRNPVIVTPHFKGRLSLQTDSATLRIINLRLSDDGWYQCKILYLDGRPISNGTVTRLIVNDPPVFRFTSPNSKTGLENQPVTLRCSVAGKPQPVVTWHKDGWLLVNGQDGYTVDDDVMVITSLSKSSAGSYTCVAKNKHGEIKHTTTVYMKAPPVITVPPKDVTVKEGQEAFFSCKASGYPSVITFSWLYNGMPVTEQHTPPSKYSMPDDGIFVINDVTKEDRGNVTCRPDNGFGSPPAASANLIIQYAASPTSMPSVAYAGLTLPFSLRCNYDAEPDVNAVTWRKDGQVVTEQQGSSNERVYVDSDLALRFREVHFVDEGRYTCTPYNVLGSTGESDPVTLVVKQPPRVALRPPATVEAEIGSTLRLPCRGAGDPPTSARWKKVGGDVTMPSDRVTWSGNGNVTISSISKADFGVWRCVVSNAVANVTADVMVFVKYTSPHKVENLTISTTSSSANIQWTPGYDGGFPQHFTIWYKKASMGDHTWSTVFVDAGRTGASVNRLEPDTVYQFAVLPENHLGSGPFSRTETMKTKAVETRPIVTSLIRALPPPSGLSFAEDERGMIVLSWKPPRAASGDSNAMLGYLIEYRILAHGGGDADTEDFSREKRSPGSPQKHGFWEEKLRTWRKKRRRRRSVEKESGVRVVQSNPSSQERKWKILAAVPSNTTSYAVDSLFRDTQYYFRVLAVTPTAYSAPSGALLVDTAGLVAYGIYSSPSTHNGEVNAGAISGIVVGTILVVVLVTSVAIYCQRSRTKTRDLQKSSYLAESDAESFLAASKGGGGDVTKHPSPRHDDATHLKVSFVKDPVRVDEDAKKGRDGVLKKIKTKLGRTKSFGGESKKSYITVKRTNSLSYGAKGQKAVTPIHRSADGKFRIDDSHASSHDVPLHGATYTSRPASVSNRAVAPRKLRPVSDSFIPRELNRFSRQKIKEIPEEEEEEEDGGALEIDCSRSDIEVRFLQSTSASSSNRTLSPRRLEIGSTSSHIYRERPTSSCTLPYSSASRQTTSFCETPPVRRVQHPPSSSLFPASRRRASSYFSNAPPADVGSVYPPAEYVYLKDLGLPCPETPMSECPDSRSFTPNPFDPKMSTHNPTPADPPKDKYHHHCTLPGGHYHLSPRGSLVEHPNQRPEQDKTFVEKNPDLPSSSDADSQSNSTRPTELRSSNSNKRVTRYNSLPNFRSHSCSMPSLSPRRMSDERGACADERGIAREKRSASEDLLTPCDEDSERRCSFTSGSASTVRRLPSKESNLCGALACPEPSPRDCLESTSSDVSGSNGPQQQRPLEALAEASSGYESQNTSSDISPFAHHALVTDHDARFHTSCHHVTNASDHASGARCSNASSADSRTRRDTSSVDEKYEWDSESAMESEILEALKNFGNHKRSGPVSADLLKELFKLGVNPNTLSLSEADGELLKLANDDSANSSLLQSSLQNNLLQVPVPNQNKESIEKRCAALREEYLQYQRRRATRDCDTENL